MENASGIYPLTNKVLVKPETEVKKKDSLIELPEDVKERHRAGQNVGTVIAVGLTCYLEEKRLFGVSPSAFRVEPGQRVIYAKYAGYQFTGKDGETYRLLYDNEIAAVCDPEVRTEIGQ